MPEAIAQPAVPVGSEMQVNTYTTGHQQNPHLVPDEAGGFVVAWHGPDGDVVGVFGRRLDSVGAPIGEEFLVNEVTTGVQRRGNVAADGLGGFAVAWAKATGADDETTGIRFRNFDSADVPLMGDFQVASSPEDTLRYPAIASLPAGGFIVVWEDRSGPDKDIRAQTFDVAGLPVGQDFMINTYTTADQSAASIGSDGGDGLVVVWTGSQSAGTDTDSLSVQMRRLDSAGQPLGEDFQINSYTTDTQLEPRVGPDGQGGFVVAWSQGAFPTGNGIVDGGAEGGGGGLPKIDLVARRFQSDGTPREPEFIVSDSDNPPELSAFPNIAPDGTGGFLIVWQTFTDHENDVYGRRFDDAAQPVGSRFLLSSFSADQQENPSVATLADGDFVVAWDSEDAVGTDTSERSIQVRRFALDHDEDGVGTPVDTCTDTDGDGFGNPGFPANTCPEDNCPEIANASQSDSDGDGVGDSCDECLGDDATGDDDGDDVCNDLDICLGDDATGDGDGDGLCADTDCNDADATNACAVFSDGFESGDTLAWTSSHP